MMMSVSIMMNMIITKMKMRMRIMTKKMDVMLCDV